MSRFFAIDFRSLAAFRVGVAGLVLADLALRAADLREHYSEEGVLPRADLLAHPVGRWLRFFSLHLLGDSVEFQALLFGLAALRPGLLGNQGLVARPAAAPESGPYRLLYAAS